MLYAIGDISLRGYEVKDAEFLKKLYTDKDYEVFFRDQPHYKTMQELEQYPTVTGSTVFVIEERNQPIGLFSLYDLRALVRSIKFGMLLDKEHQNKKIAVTVGQIICPYIFKRVGLNKLECEIVEFDTRLIASMKLWNFKVDGVNRDGAFLNGEFYNCITMSLTKKEYEET